MNLLSNQRITGGLLGFRVGCLLFALLCASQVAASENGRSWSGTLGFESRYVSEGSNTLDHGGIATLGLELEQETGFGDFAVELDVIQGVAVNFRETEAGVGYGKEIGDFAASLSWVRIKEEERDENEYDSEWAAGLAYEGWERVTPSVEYVYSTEAHGGLLVLMLEGEVEVAGRNLSPYLLVDIDYDYVSEDYDGLNHIELGLSSSVSLTDDLEMTFHVAYSNAQKNLRREEEDRDYFWGGVSFSL